MWRPKGWKCKYLGKKANRYFELGADAMLRALKEHDINLQYDLDKLETEEGC